MENDLINDQISFFVSRIEDTGREIQGLSDIIAFAIVLNNRDLIIQIELLDSLHSLIKKEIQKGNIRRACVHYSLLISLKDEVFQKKEIIERQITKEVI